MRDWFILSCFACVVGVQGDTIGMGWDGMGLRISIERRRFGFGHDSGGG